MGLKLDSYEEFKKQATSNVGGSSSSSSSSSIGGDSGEAKRYGDVSLFANEENKDRKQR